MNDRDEWLEKFDKSLLAAWHDDDDDDDDDTCKQNIYLYKTELFEIELFICIKMGLELMFNNS